MNELFLTFSIKKKNNNHEIEKTLLKKQSLYTTHTQAFFKLKVLTDYYTSIGLALFM